MIAKVEMGALDFSSVVFVAGCLDYICVVLVTRGKLKYSLESGWYSLEWCVSSTRAWQVWSSTPARGAAIELIETDHCLAAVQSLNMSEASRSLGTQQSADAVAVVHAPIGY